MATDDAGPCGCGVARPSRPTNRSAVLTAALARTTSSTPPASRRPPADVAASSAEHHSAAPAVPRRPAMRRSTTSVLVSSVPRTDYSDSGNASTETVPHNFVSARLTPLRERFTGPVVVDMFCIAWPTPAPPVS